MKTKEFIHEKSLEKQGKSPNKTLREMKNIRK